MQHIFDLIYHESDIPHKHLKRSKVKRMSSLYPSSALRDVEVRTYILTNMYKSKGIIPKPNTILDLTNSGHSVILIDENFGRVDAPSVQNDDYRRLQELKHISNTNPSIRIIDSRPTLWDWVIDSLDVEDRDNVFYIDYSNNKITEGMTEELFVMAYLGKYNRKHSYFMNVPFEQLKNLKKPLTYDYYSGEEIKEGMIFEKSVIKLLMDCLAVYLENGFHERGPYLPPRMTRINLYNVPGNPNYPMILNVPALKCLELSKRMLPDLPRHDHLSRESTGITVKRAMSTMGTYREIYTITLAKILSNFVVNNHISDGLFSDGYAVDWLDYRTWREIASKF